MNYQTTNIINPGPNDVLCGRGAVTNAHPGNIKFRQLVAAHKLRYLAASRSEGKPGVARDVVREWRAMDPPGRFLSKMKPSPNAHMGAVDVPIVWYDVGDKKAREKASQCLRERNGAANEAVRKIHFSRPKNKPREPGRPTVSPASSMPMMPTSSMSPMSLPERPRVPPAAMSLPGPRFGPSGIGSGRVPPYLFQSQGSAFGRPRGMRELQELQELRAMQDLQDLQDLQLAREMARERALAGLGRNRNAFPDNYSSMAATMAALNHARRAEVLSRGQELERERAKEILARRRAEEILAQRRAAVKVADHHHAMERAAAAKAKAVDPGRSAMECMVAQSILKLSGDDSRSWR